MPSRYRLDTLVITGDFIDIVEHVREAGAAAAMILLYALALYVLIGFATAVAFVSFGLSRVLPHSMTASLPARLLFIPGATALWPYVLTRWLQSRDVS